MTKAAPVLALASAAAVGMLIPAGAHAARDASLDGPQGPTLSAAQQSLRDFAYTQVVNDPRPRTDAGLRLRTWNGVQQGDLHTLARSARTEATPLRVPDTLAARDTRVGEPGFRFETTGMGMGAQHPIMGPAVGTSLATRDSVPSRGMFAMPEPAPVARGGGPSSGPALAKGPQTTAVDDNAPSVGVRSIQHVPLQLGLGCTTITAVGTPAVREVSLRVVDPLGGRATHDTRNGRTESLAFCPTRPGAYALDVQLDGQGTGPLAAQVFVGR